MASDTGNSRQYEKMNCKHIQAHTRNLTMSSQWDCLQSTRCHGKLIKHHTHCRTRKNSNLCVELELLALSSVSDHCDPVLLRVF